MPSGFGPVKTLMESDYCLMLALRRSQQNFAISNPSLPDNPIMNCRFLQEAGTNQVAVDVIRKCVREGTDTSVCLLNSKADRMPFWNQFFFTPLREAENYAVNFVGVQCRVNKEVVEKHISEWKTPTLAKEGT
ncbi:hypothetical protein ACHAWF_015370 [Thalassiosira exigua]